MTTAPLTPTSNKLLIKLIAAYKTPSIGNSIWQILNTLLPYIALWILMIYAFTHFILAGISIDGIGGRFYHPDVHYFSRLRPWCLL